MNVYRVRQAARWAILAVVCLALGIAASAAPPNIYLTPPDITPTSFWRIDYWDFNPSFSPTGQIAQAPVALSQYGQSALSMIPGDGIGGTGCARLGGKVHFGTQDLDGVLLSSINTLSYSYLTDELGSGPTPTNLAPYVNIFIDRNGDGIWRGADDTILIYEPIYTRGNGFVTVDTWYSDNIVGASATGRWHTAAQPITGVGAGSPAAPNDTWAEVMLIDLDGAGPGTTLVRDLPIANPDPGCDDPGTLTSDEGTGNGLAFVVGQKSGDGWTGWEGFLDAVQLGVNPSALKDVDITLYGPPANMVKTSGDNQSQDLGFLFDDPLTVVVTDAIGNPVIGETVTFTAPGVGASATVTASVVTDATGKASTNAIANLTAGGAYNVTAALGALSANFALTNTDPGAAVKTFVLAQDIGGVGDLWIVDYYDNDPVNSPDGQLAFNPAGIAVPLAGYGTSSFQMLTGPGLGGTGCARLGGKVFLGTQQLNGVSLKDLKSLSYSFLLEDTDDFNYGVYINIFVDKNGDGLWVGSQDSILVYEAIKPGNTPGPVTMTANTWYEPVAIGPLSTGRWHSAAQTLGTISPNNPGAVDTWNEILAEPFAGPFGDTVGDLRIVNPIAGCDDAGPSSDEGTGSGLVIVIGQKNGVSYSNADAHVDKVSLTVDGLVTPKVFDFSLFGDPANIAKVSGDNQSQDIGFNFDQPLTVQITDSGGNPIIGETVTFTAPGVGASASVTASVVTDATGTASTWALANLTAGGPYNVTATLGLLSTNFALTNTDPGAFTKQYVLPQDIGGVGDFWMTDVYNNVPANAPFVTGTLAANPPGTVNPIASFGTSSFQMRTGPGVDTLGQTGCARTGGKVFLGTTALAGVALKDIKGFSYAFLFENTSLDFNYSPYINIYVDLNGNGTWEAGVGGDAMLVYDAVKVGNLPGPGTRTADTWYETTAIGPLSTGRWAASTNTFAGIPLINPAPTGSTWNEILVKPYVTGHSQTVGDLKVVNPTPGCDDGGPSDDEGTATGFNIQTGQKNGGAYNNADHHIEKVSLYIEGQLAPTTFDLNLYGDPAIITKVSGDNQSQDIGFVFDDPLTVQITDINGNPIPGLTVNFAAPGAGASASVTASVITDASGMASTNAIANLTAGGPYNVSATSGLLTTNFALTNTDPGALAKTYVLPQDLGGVGDFWKIDYFDQNTTSDPNPSGMIAASPVGAVNPPTGYGASSLQMINGPGLGGSGCLGQGGKVFLGTTNLNGVALRDIKHLSYSLLLETQSFNLARPYINVFIDLNGDNLWRVADDMILVYETIYGDNLPGISANLNEWYETVAIGPLSTGDWHAAVRTVGGIGLGSPAAISDWNEILAEPYLSVSGTTVGDLKIVNPVGGCNGTTATEGTASGFALVTGQKSGSGWIDADIHVDKVGLYVEGAVTPKVYDFALFGDPASIVVSGGNNQSTTVNTAFALPLEVTVTDVYGNPVSGATVTFTAPLSGASASFTPVNGQAVTDASGKASILATANTVAGGYSVTATVGLFNTTFSLTNTAGAAASMTITGGNNQSAVVLTAFAAPLEVTVTDSFSNPVSGVLVTFTAPVSGASAAFTPANGEDTTDAAGKASVVATANGTAGAYSVGAAAGALNASFSLTNTFGAPATLVVSGGNNQSATVNTAFALPLEVTLTDANGNPVSGATVTFTAPLSGASASFTPVNGEDATDAAGKANVLATANTVAGGYSVTAAIGAVNTTFSLTNTAGAAATMTITGGNNQSAVVLTAFAAPLEVTVTDSFSNPVSGVLVTFTAPVSGASAAFTPANGEDTTDAAGKASVVATANGTAGAYSVGAAAGALNASFSLTNTFGAPATLVVSGGNNQSATVNTAFAQPLEVTLTDANGNPVSGATITFTSPVSGASAAFTPVNGQAVTDASGKASVLATANTVAGGYSVTAAIGAVNTTFSLTNTAGAAATMTISGGNNQSTPFSTAFAVPLEVTLTDSFSNPVSGVLVTFTAPVSGASAAFTPANGEDTTDAAGVASVIATANGTVGAYSVTSAAGALNASFSLKNMSAAPDTITKIGGNDQHATVSTAFALPLEVLVQDAFDNPAEGVTVQFAILSRNPEASFTPASGLAVTDASGIASILVTANAEVGPYEVNANVGTIYTTFILTNDPDAVNAPVDLAAVAVGQTLVNLTWTDTSTVEDTLALYRSDDGGTTFNVIAAPAAGSTAYSDSGLLCSTTYSYRLDVTNVVGTDSSNIAVVTTNACGELLVNGSFEAVLPGTWTGVNITGDKRKCNNPANAFDGLCSLVFKGGVGEASIYKQVVGDLSALTAGDTLYLSAAFKSNAAAPNLMVRAIVKYGPVKDKPLMKFLTTSATFIQDTEEYVLTGTPTKIVVQIKHRSASGKVFVDVVSLTVNNLGSRGGDGILPPPSVPDAFRGSN